MTLQYPKEWGNGREEMEIHVNSAKKGRILSYLWALFITITDFWSHRLLT